MHCELRARHSRPGRQVYETFVAKDGDGRSKERRDFARFEQFSCISAVLNGSVNLLPRTIQNFGPTEGWGVTLWGQHVTLR